MPPKNVAGSIVRGDDFWGRKDEVAEVWRRVERGHVLLSNPRRYGKSSLMTALQDAPAAGWTVVYVDVYPVESPREFLVELGAGLLAAIPTLRARAAARGAPAGIGRWFGRAVEEVTVSVPDVAELRMTLREQIRPIEDWRDAGNQLLDHVAAANRNILLIVDEFPSMVATLLAQDRAAALSMLRWLRTRRAPGGTHLVRFLFGGSVNMEPLLEEIGEEKLINDLDRYRFDPFPPAKARAFVEEVARGEGYPDTGDFADRLVAVADTGVPFFLQVVVSACLMEARRRRVLPQAVDVAAVFHDQVLGPMERARFSHYLSRLKEEAFGRHEEGARLILGAVAEADVLTVGQLVIRLRESGINPVDLPAILTRLQSDYYIVVDGEAVRFTSGFLRQWWLRNAPRRS